MPASPNTYSQGMSVQQIQGALAIDIPALYAGMSAIVGANPAASIGLARVNGVAVTFMRSDAAPALDQSIAPTWIGTHTFAKNVIVSAPAAGTALTANGLNNQLTALFTGNAAAGQSYGVAVNAGTNNVDYCAVFQNQTASATYLKIGGDGKVALSGPLGVNGVAPPAQVTGFGTPTGAAVIANFPGASATLVQCSNTIAELIAVLKGLGLLGA